MDPQDGGVNELDVRTLVEMAPDLARRLQALTAALSVAADQRQVLQIVVDMGREALGAITGFVWLLRGDELELAVPEGRGRAPLVERFSRIPLSTHLPVCDAIRTGQPFMFESLAAMAAIYPATAAASESPSRAWAVVPIVVGGRGLGAVSFSFADERSFGQEERELLVGLAEQASRALERCGLAESAGAGEG
jgi:GAF domain-containing protein